MKKTILSLLFGVALATAAFGQTALTSTTLSAAITTTSGTTVVVASATGITAGSTVILVDRELMYVNAVSGTTLTVGRGYSQTRAATHANSATVYAGQPQYFPTYARFGTCTRANELALPQIIASAGSANGFSIADCFGSAWQFDLNLPLYKLSMAAGAQPSAAAPAAGSASSLTAQAGGASTAAGTAGGAGAAFSVIAGAGGAGASTGTAGAGGAANLTAGAGGAAAGAAATGGAGGTVTITAGASGGTVTSGNGGAVNIIAGASANGSTAAGNGGDVTIKAGAVGTGGTGTAGKVKIKDATDATKIVVIDPSGNSTAITETLAFGATAARTATFPDASITVSSIVTKSCGTTTTCAATTTNNVIEAWGSVALSSASPSTASLTALPFTSSTTYFCSATPVGTTAAIAAGGIAINPTSGSAATLTGPNTVTTVVHYHCVGT